MITISGVLQWLFNQADDSTIMFFSVLTCVLASKFWYHRCCWRMTVGWWFVRVYATQYIGDYHIHSPIYCGLSWIIKTHKLGTKFLTNQRVEVVEASQSRYLNQTHYSTIKKSSVYSNIHEQSPKYPFLNPKYQETVSTSSDALEAFVCYKPRIQFQRCTSKNTCTAKTLSTNS